MDDVLVHKVAEMLAIRAGSGAFLFEDLAEEQDEWTYHARSALLAVELTLLSDPAVQRAASALGEEALNLMDCDLGTLHVEQLARTAILAALGTDEATLYDRRLSAPLSTEAAKSLANSLADGTVPRRKVKKRDT